MNHYNPSAPDLTAVLAAIGKTPEYTSLERAMFSMACVPDSVFARDAAIRAMIVSASAHVAAAVADIQAALTHADDECVIEQLESFLLEAPWTVSTYLAAAASVLRVQA